MASRSSLSPRAVARREKQLARMQCQLRIELNELQPLVWRRLLVPEDIPLVKLNVVLQQAMGWRDGHLHEYIVGRRHYGGPDEDWRRKRLSTLVESGARRFTYLYGLGGGWEHGVKIEDFLPPPQEGMRIRCLAGENACPPWHVGGPHSYFDFLMAVKDPTHEEHKSVLQRIGSFDPTAFNIEDVNKRLGDIRA